MVKCPNCSNVFEIGSLICPRKVSITKRSKIASLNKQITKGTERAKKYIDVSTQLINFNGNISSKAVLTTMGWADHSDGDVMLVFLDNLVCIGALEKVRHKKGRGGHLYSKKIEGTICPYFKKGECTCDLSLYTHIDEDQVA